MYRAIGGLYGGTRGVELVGDPVALRRELGAVRTAGSTNAVEIGRQRHLPAKP
jgi:hypothetical protein